MAGGRWVDVASPASPVEVGLVALVLAARLATRGVDPQGVDPQGVDPQGVDPQGVGSAGAGVGVPGDVEDVPVPESKTGARAAPASPCDSRSPLPCESSCDSRSPVPSDSPRSPSDFPPSSSTCDSPLPSLVDSGSGSLSGPVVVGSAGARVRRHAPTGADWVADHPLAARLDGLFPDAGLVGLLVSLEPADVDDAALVEMVAGWERVVSSATARQGRVITELARRRAAQGRGAYVADEVAARLATTRAGAEVKVGLAGLLDRMPTVDDALARGDIDTRKATLITEELMGLPGDLARAITEEVLPDAPVLTGPRIRARIRRLELTVNPGAAHDRHTRARRGRHVVLTPARDAMAWLGAYLPADDAVAVHTALTAVADSAPPDDPRPVDARRADALVALATRVLDTGAGPDGPLPTRQHRHPHLNVTASATTLLGLDDNPGELAGYGPIPADMARRIAARATWRPLLADAVTGELAARGNTTYRPSTGVAGAVVDRDATCTFRECRVPAHRCQIDHITPYDPARPATDQTVVGGLDAKCTHHHQAKTHGGWTTTRDPLTGTTTWTAPTGHTYPRPPHPTHPPDPPRTTTSGSTPPPDTDPPTDPGHPPDPDRPADPGHPPDPSPPEPRPPAPPPPF